MTLAEHTPPLWRRLITRLDPRAYLTLHIVVGLLICLLTAWIFAALLESVHEHDVLVHRDQAIANWFHGNGTAFGDRGQRIRVAPLVWGGSAPPGNATVKGEGAPLGAPACGALDSRGGHVAHALHPPQRRHSPASPPDGGRRLAGGDGQASMSGLIWGAAPPRRTPIVKTSRRWRDAAFGGLDIGGRRGIHASFPPRRRHSPASRPCGRRRCSQRLAFIRRRPHPP